MASRNGGIPDTGVYLVSPRSIAAIAAFLMLSGVSKSGSPVDSETISRPALLRSRAFCVTAIVAEGFTRKRASARKDTGKAPVRKMRAQGRMQSPQLGADLKFEV